MLLETKKHLHDILEATKEIQTYVGDIGYSTYLSENMVQSAVERKFEIIGETLNRLQRSDAIIFKEITNAQRIIDFRNILAHGYDVIDPAIVWDIIKNHLPTLRMQIENLLTHLDKIKSE
jgi:uncharacterized protein with HEPN domain